MDREQAQVVALRLHPKRLQLQCVGSLQVQRTLGHGADVTLAELGFICGSLPVPTASPPKAFSSTAVVSTVGHHSKRVVAPQYKILPAETDLNGPLSDSEQPLIATRNDSGDLWGGSTSKTLAQKCDALAVNTLSGHGDEIDVIAPVDILKQIFKSPYSNARVSVAVHRVGRTLILNSGPDEDCEKKKNNAKLGEKLLYSRFVQHSVQQSSTPSCVSQASDHSPETECLSTAPSPWQVIDEEDICNNENLCATLRLPSQHKGKKRVAPVQKSSLLGDQTQDADYMKKDAETQERTPDGFLRVLFWQFQNLRMLLGSDLLVFSNDKHVAVSLHLVEIERQASPLMWLDAWLDNVMASVPELAICYHHNGVVQGYELLKTDDIFSLKGLAEDGTVFFQPHVVQQNALSVLRFLQEKCKHDPGTYWLFKNAGEDVFRLFDHTGGSKSCNKDEKQSSLPSGNASRGNLYTLPLAMLLYRIAYILSRSQESSDICKCAKLFRKCLEFLDNQEHLVLRAIAHEQVARLILSCCKEHGSVTKPVLLLEAYEPGEPEAIISAHKDRSSAPDIRAATDSICIEELNPPSPREVDGQTISGLCAQATSADLVTETVNKLAVSSIVECPAKSVIPVSDSVSARLAAVHHISEAVISLRCQRQLQDVDKKKLNGKPEVKQFPLCLCGDIECITFYDIRSSEFGVIMDQKLKELISMLGESYLALGEAYKEEGQLSRAVKAAELACSVYGSVLLCNGLVAPYGCQYCLPGVNGVRDALKSPSDTKPGNTLASELWKGVFWGQLWRLIGDLYIKNLLLLSESGPPYGGSKDEELQMAEEIVKEVKRLRKKAGQKPGCGVCSSSDCSCHMDRVSSGSSATSSTEYNIKSSRHGLKYRKLGKAPGISDDGFGSSASIKINGTEDEGQKALDASTEISKQASKQICRSHVCFHLQRVLTNDFKPNYLAAVDCYDAAIYALTDVPGTSKELEAATRKKGWACNELARSILAMEDLTLSETAFRTAIQAFQAVGDSTNVVYVSSNLGHVLRGAAEKLVAWILAGTLTVETFEHVAAQAKELYEKALRCYAAAKQEAANLENPDLEKKVVTQLANTYLRLGMFLAREQTAGVVNNDGEREALAECYKTRGPTSLPANAAISEALVLYESTGQVQEAAYAHFQLGCHLKSRLSKMVKSRTDNTGDRSLKHYALLAERHLRKASEYYQAEHPSMFLEVLQVQCELCLSSIPFSNSNQMLDQALSHLLDGRRALRKNCPQPSSAIANFLKELQTLLKSILGAAVAVSKVSASTTGKQHKSGNVSESCQSSSARVLDVAKLKEMYRIALRSTESSLPNDLDDLCKLWSGHHERNC